MTRLGRIAELERELAAAYLSAATERQRSYDMKRVLLEVRAILDDERWGTIDYMDGSDVYRDLERGKEIIDDAIAGAAAKPPSPAPHTDSATPGVHTSDVR